MNEDAELEAVARTIARERRAEVVAAAIAAALKHVRDVERAYAARANTGEQI